MYILEFKALRQVKTIEYCITRAFIISSIAEFCNELLTSSEYDIEDVFRKALSNHPLVNVANGGGIRVTMGNLPTPPFQYWDGICTRDCKHLVEILVNFRIFLVTLF